ncbi:MAG: SpoIIE family protein phosphatase, partial [Deltaproteobacteria bacterium]|nr:SpoIIE family protein phosphatase [Deltaproteobacteria bacterium]
MPDTGGAALLQPNRAPVRRPALLLSLALAVPLLGGCADLGYYLRAASGQSDLQARARPVDEVVADPSTPEWLRDRLRVADELRSFAARELLLDDGSSFRTYADLGRPYAVWNVVAAPEFSTRPKQWCFPVAGCVSYRGYFSQDEAGAFAEGLRREGYDVVVEGAPAYSTLGWFQDPLLNTFIRSSDRELAGLLFHELAHRRLYVKDDSAFNESFATAVELEGLRRWLAASGRAGEAAEAERAEARARGFRAYVAAWRQRLEAVYAAGGEPDEKRERKRRAFDDLRAGYGELRASWGGYTGYDGWFARELYNALYAERRELAYYRDMMEREQAVAKTLFESVARNEALGTPNIRYVLSPMSMFNGDVLFSARTPAGDLHILLGDFTGHGLAASIGALPASDIFYAMAAKGFDLPAIAAEINARLVRLLPTGMFCA